MHQIQRNFLESLGKTLGFKEYDDWYSLTEEAIRSHGGSQLLDLHKGSTFKLLETTFTEHQWVPWKLSLPRGYWNDSNNRKFRRNFMDSMAKELRFSQMEDWYSVTVEDFRRFGGLNLLQAHSNSPLKVLESVYPEHDWQFWKMQKAPRDSWTSLYNQRKYVEWLGCQLGVLRLEDWYQVTVEIIVRHGGDGLLQRFGNSPLGVLENVYPEHEWLPWMFVTSPKKWWKQRGNLRLFMGWLGKELKVDKMEDWYRVSAVQIESVAPTSVLKSFGGLGRMLLEGYPDHPWDKDRLLSNFRAEKASQRLVLVTMREIFPQSVMHEDYHHPDLTFTSGRPMQLDLYVPDLRLAVEFQGKQHYSDIYVFGQQRKYAERDDEKRNACRKEGITLIEVPYWWDFRKESLAATIYEARPELFDPSTVDPKMAIPKELPQQDTLGEVTLILTRSRFEPFSPLLPFGV